MRALILMLVAAAIVAGPGSAGAQGAVDTKAEIAAALFAASATQAAVEKAEDAKITAQQGQIVALAAKVRAGQAKQAELTQAQQGFVAELAAKDRAYSAVIESFRGAVTHITATPEGAAALAKYNSGDEAGAIAILDQLNDARDAALQKATDIQKAVGRRDEAQLAANSQAHGKVPLAPVIALFEKVVALDPGVWSDWAQLAELYRISGRLVDARTAADRAVATAPTDFERNVALADASNVYIDQGDLAGGRKALEQARDIATRLMADSPSDSNLQRTLVTCSTFSTTSRQPIRRISTASMLSVSASTPSRTMATWC